MRVRLDWQSHSDNVLRDEDLREHLFTDKLTPLDSVAIALCELLLWQREWAQDICMRQLRIKVTGLAGGPHTSQRSRFATFELSFDTETLKDDEIDG